MPRHTIHVISHTHWDREWYLPFELHRRRLVALLDELLERFERDQDYRHFHMDGQVVPLLDYLEIRPHRREDIVRAVQTGRMSVGPWFVLQDEYLTSGEANVRNMLIGLRLAREFGEPMSVGYLPDAFGNISQMPQILAGFDIDSAVFGRGVGAWPPPAWDGTPERADYNSEWWWESPDGSKVLGIFFANWYANAVTIPADPDTVLDTVQQLRRSAATFASTSHLLFMNGSDHTPSQPDVADAIRLANERLEDAKMVHSNFTDYIAAVRAELGELDTHHGEMRSLFTDGWGTLTNVLSSRIYQKQANYRCQNLLEKWVEPFAAVAWKLGVGTYDADLLRHAWKTLMLNHPHDSICGCSVDPVHREMDVRFEKVEQLGGQLAAEALKTLADRVQAPVGVGDTEAATVVVFNPTAGRRCEVVSAVVDFPEKADIAGLRAVDTDGKEVPCGIAEDLGVVWMYRLPDVGFREVYHARRIRVEFLADVPGMGYAACRVEAAPDACKARSVETRAMENEHFRLEIADDGTLTLTDKATGERFEGVHRLEDSLDVGNEYDYRAPAEDEIVSPVAADTTVEAIERSSVGERCTVRTSLSVRGEMLPISYTLLLAHGSRRVDVSLTVDNRAWNHRLRVLVPTDTKTDTAYADGQFDVVARAIQPMPNWTNPSYCHAQQAFVRVADERRGIALANRGLPEYEVLRDGRNTIALTLLRAVGELGDWGVFPTPQAQCERKLTLEYAIIPQAGAFGAAEAEAQGRAFAAPLQAVQAHAELVADEPATAEVKKPEAALPSTSAFVELSPNTLVLSAVKKAEDRDGVVVRLYNPTEQAVKARLRTALPVREAHEVNLAERRLGKLSVKDGAVELDTPAKKIVTVELI